MKLTVLGKYGPFPKENGGTSSYLLEASGSFVLLDAGESSFSRLVGILPPEKIDAFVITHFHHDHVCDLGVYSYYFERLALSGKLAEKPLLFCPDDESAISSFYLSSPYFQAVEVRDGLTYSHKGKSFTFYKTAHPVSSYGVKISDGEKTFSFMGDTNVCENLPSLAGGADFLLADGCFRFSDWSDKKPHLSVRHCVDLSRKYGATTLITHINPSYDEDVLRSDIAGENGVFIAEEFKTYDI